ncbi:MAG: SPW repeat protein [Actinomycetota bacterium]|nr:SPW repeat protein [Actinomycetota bacterium]
MEVSSHDCLEAWQDYATMVFGVLLFIVSPFVFGQTSHQVASVTAYVLGALLFLSGVVAAATRAPRNSVLLNAPGAVALITFVAAAVLGITGSTWIALAAGVLAIATLLVAATFRLGNRDPMKVA